MALEDRCCHRQALSMGRLIGDVVQCPYDDLELTRAAPA